MASHRPGFLAERRRPGAAGAGAVGRVGWERPWGCVGLVGIRDQRAGPWAHKLRNGIADRVVRTGCGRTSEVSSGGQLIAPSTRSNERGPAGSPPRPAGVRAPWTRRLKPAAER